MANDAKKISELSVITSSNLGSNDKVVVLHYVSGVANTVTMTVQNLANKLAANVMPAANTSSAGVVKVDGSSITISNGVISVTTVVPAIPGPYANNDAAAAANVPIKGLYYDSSGAVRIRIS